MLRYKIKKISEVPNDALSNFYKKTYKSRCKSLISNWKWWYRVGYNQFEPITILINNEVIGHAGLIPIDLDILGKNIQAIWFVDFAVLPEYQGSGYGKILTKEWMKICPNQITFCNEKSLGVFKKFGWKNNLSTQRMAKPINILKVLPVIKNFEFNLLNKSLIYYLKRKHDKKESIKCYDVNNNFNVLKESFKLRKLNNSLNLAKIVRDENWLKWRIMECPYKKDLYFFEYNNSFSIVHIFKEGNTKKMNILFTYHVDNDHENHLMSLILQWSIYNNIDLLWTVSSKSKFKEVFSKIYNKSLNFASWSADKKISDILKNGLSDPQAIDSDTDSSLYIE